MKKSSVVVSVFIMQFILVGLVNASKIERKDVDHQQRVKRNAPATLAEVVKVLNKLEAKVNRLTSDRLMLLRGRDGRDGRDGPQGAKGIRGQPGTRGGRGPKGERSGGVKYVRWGRTTCSSGASLVYKGRIGGERFTHTGGGVNYLCLTENPVYERHKDGHQSGGFMYGTEYEVSGFNPLSKSVHDQDAPCAVCYVMTRNTKLMIPATNVCPAGWTREYYGYLMTAHRAHVHPAEFVCVDKDAESIVGGNSNQNGALLYPVEGVCGSLPCGPYVAGWELTCAVCTK